MSDQIKGIYGSAGNPAAQSATKNRNEGIGKNEFLQLLVTQLKYQDPLEPMQNEDFAVNLAQFSQLEQLVSINERMSALDSSAGNFHSLAGYLGHEVTLNTNLVKVNNGDGGILKFELTAAANSLAIELLNSDGTVKEKIELGQMDSGKHSVKLDNLETKNGEFGFRIVAQADNGSTIETAGKVAGIVSGFVPGPDAALIVGGQHISLLDVIEVNMANG
jgi:flagellar basal-body rod modification protein FlgD